MLPNGVADVKALHEVGVARAWAGALGPVEGSFGPRSLARPVHLG